MSLVLIAVLGVVGWLSMALFLLALCHEAARADELADVRPARDANLIDFAAARETRRPAASYFSSRDSRRSLSSLPSV